MPAYFGPHSSAAMKVLFDHSQPFLLAHGGYQIQIEQTKRALEQIGVEIEFLRWWDDKQTGEIIHFFGLPHTAYVEVMRQKRIKLVVTHLLGGLGARQRWKRLMQKLVIGAALHALPADALARMGWKVWQMADAYVAVTRWEAGLMNEVFRVPRRYVHFVPNGVDELFLNHPATERGKWLVTTASILPVKRLLETAEAAVLAQTPYWVIGRPLSESDAYYQRFFRFCRNHSEIVRYDNVMRTHAELAEVYRQARGFVLLSRWETQSLSALEAAASECPLLISDLPWARSTFGDHVSYCPLGSKRITAGHLRRFYDQAPMMGPPPKPLTWTEVAKVLKEIYEHVIRTDEV
jgi:glycosyltransferase involved in cell wall biosynthesis